MTDPELMKWIHEFQGHDLKAAVKLWKDGATFLDDKDPVMATLCRRIGADLERLAERMLAHLLDDKLAQVDQQDQDMEQMIEQLFKKANER